MMYCFRARLYRQGLFHDLSKLSPQEFLVGAKYWKGTESPNNSERKDTGVSLAWLHHKGRNKHHFEYWIDYMGRSDPRTIGGARMPRRYVAEMVFDRVSASRTYQGEAYTDRSALDYYLRSKDKLWFVHKDTREQMEFLLTMWAEKGEDATVAYIRDVFLREGK